MNKKPSRVSVKKDQKESKQFVEDPTLTKMDLNIVLVYSDRENIYEELVPNQTVYVTVDKQIVLERLVDSLRQQSFLTQQSALSYEDSTRSSYIYCGYIKNQEKLEQQPINPRIIQEYNNIPLKFVNSGQLKIKVRKSKKSLVQSLLDQQKRNSEKQAVEDQKNAKQKQKRIGEVVQKVALWRRFYTGFYDEKGTYVQKPLQTAASQVGVAKKTLDDYLLQIRCGKKYGFNFNANVNSKIGELRAFVRQAKRKEEGK